MAAMRTGKDTNQKCEKKKGWNKRNDTNLRLEIINF